MIWNRPKRPFAMRLIAAAKLPKADTDEQNRPKVARAVA